MAAVIGITRGMFSGAFTSICLKRVTAAVTPTWRSFMVRPTISGS
jgi:hypothetical protein